MMDNGLKWSIVSDHWELTCTRSSDEPYITNLQVTKNGQDMAVRYVTQAENNHIGATFCAALPLEDFAGLFNLQYETDEENRSVYFESVRRNKN